MSELDDLEQYDKTLDAMADTIMEGKKIPVEVKGVTVFICKAFLTSRPEPQWTHIRERIMNVADMFDGWYEAMEKATKRKK